MHIEYNAEAKLLHVLHDFDDMADVLGWKTGNIGDYGLAQLNNKLMIYGGCSYTIAKRLMDQICEYDVVRNAWNALRIAMPEHLYNFGCTSAIRNQYVLIFGGMSLRDRIDDIWIYSVKDQIFIKSKVKCPTKNACQALAINDARSDELTVFGFILNTWKTSEINNLIFPPRYLIKLNNKFYLD